MSKMSKSLAELDALADEMLAKSVKDTDDEDEITPDEIVDDSTPTPEEDTEDIHEKDVEKCGKSLKKGDGCCDDKDITKSDDDDDVEDDDLDDEDEDIDKCGGNLKKGANCDDDEDLDKGAGCKDCKKSDDGDDDLGEDDEDEDIEVEEDIEETEKSFRAQLEGDPLIKAMNDNSEYAYAITNVLSKSLADLQYGIRSAQRDQADATETIAKSMVALARRNEDLEQENKRLSRRINGLKKSFNEGIERILDAIDEMSSQPAGMRKSVSSVSIHDRDFGRSLGGAPSEGFDSLSKSQVLDILTNELYTGNQAVTNQDIIGYESGAPLRNDLQQLVAQKARH